MAGENFDIVSWEIENFSCWNQALHGTCIDSPDIIFSLRTFKMKLYPRGTSGQEDRMVVHLSFIRQGKELSGDLSYIGADGSTLCTQQVNSKTDESVLELPPGPKFEEAIAKISENESDRNDQLTLRLQIKSSRYDEQQLCTVIQIFDVTMEADPSLMLENNEIISVIRCIHDDYKISTFLKTGHIREDKKVELYLYCDTKTFFVKTHLSLINSVGSLLRYEINEHMLQNTESWAFSESLTKRELSENVRSIILHLKIISGKISHTLKNVYPVGNDGIKIIPKRYVSVCEEKSHNAIPHKDQESASVYVLSKELMCLYQDQDFSDLLLKCESVSFPVHRSILSARSTVFKTMLSTDMTEAASGCVDIEDLDPSTLSRFLAFLYTGAVEDLQGESALKLYYAADKYNVPSLKRECVGFLSANVSVSNVCDVLSLGDKHQDEKLTAAAHNFILRNFNEVLNSSHWNSFMCSEPLLAVKTVTHFAAKGFVGNLKPL